MSHRPGHSQTRPKVYELDFKSILTFPLRICNPPPAVGKVRSCGVTPLFKVKLEDVLNRNHLPPLGLKDFEEWLLYVEMCPENLYFTLWLREYRERYSAWMEQNKLQRQMDGEFRRMNWEPHHSPSLAMFYARAKQTFFTPNSLYELNLPSSLLAVFHTSMESPHPDPAIFTDVAIETYRMLDESLRRFVSAQFNNVGNNRVLCGIIAGIFFALAGSLPPIILNFVRHDSRWMRILAFPGLFLGLSILLSAFNGICLGVYIFGDLRQLRKFELARPPISRPVPIAEPKSSMHSVAVPVPLPVIPQAVSTQQIPPVSVEKKSTEVLDGQIAHVVRPPSYLSSDADSLYTVTGEDEDSVSNHGPAEIQISPAFYDESSILDMHDIQSIMAAPAEYVADYTFPTRSRDGERSPVDSDFTVTAGFIHPFDTACVDPTECDRPDFSPAQLQPIDAFDFDALPHLQSSRLKKAPSRHYDRYCCRNSASLDLPSPSRPNFSRPTSRVYPAFPPIDPPPSSATNFMERRQSRCDIKKWRLQTESSDRISAVTPTGFPTSVDPYNSHILYKSRRSLTTEATSVSADTKVHKRFRLMQAVPAFAVPLTRVLSPVIRRGQWEIVVRSGAVAFLLSWVVVGILLAIPVSPRR